LRAGSGIGTGDISASVVGMQRRGVKVARGSDLDDLAEIHHRHAVAYVLDD
jgi:hypothetical protein